MKNKFQVGDLVKRKQITLDEPIGTIGYVYEEYQFGDHHGVSVITENGVDTGGWSIDEQEIFLEFYKHTSFIYRFENVINLDRDYENGIFNEVFGIEGEIKKDDTRECGKRGEVCMK